MKKENETTKLEACAISRWDILRRGVESHPYERFLDLYKKEAGILLDARTPEEFEGFHLEGALNVNYLSRDLADKLEALPTGRPFFVYCRTGRRSLRVCVLLKNMGFRVVNMEAGIKEVFG
jgi:rhodanese-related sulfurtransferase